MPYISTTEATRYPAVRNFDQFFFLEIARSIPLKTQDICLEISSDCKYCLGLKVEATVVLGHKSEISMFSTLKKYSSSYTLSQFPMNNIHRNYQRNPTRVVS